MGADVALSGRERGVHIHMAGRGETEGGDDATDSTGKDLPRQNGHTRVKRDIYKKKM